ncbi:hypothetical protein BDY24DRAFT_404130 [Mrakia frigida]|uniref:uncharacterized protein n=1 Tax=Mrakia frigida TaxID=29902 RepID=UPI003FCBEFC5
MSLGGIFSFVFLSLGASSSSDFGPLTPPFANAAAPEKSALGAVNAIAQLLACASRSVGPIIAG